MISDRHILQRVNDHFDRHAYQHIASPPTQPRRAGVAAILRWHSSNPSKDLAGSAPVQSLDDFWQLPWVKNDEHGRLELLFMLRATRAGDRFSNHVAFPGGKNEPGETDKDTVVREVQEEIGLDLASKDFLLLGTLDDRELTSTYDRKLLMILVPFVYLQVVPETPEMTLEAGEVAAVDWIPLQFFVAPKSQLRPSMAQVQESLAPRVIQDWRRPFLQFLLGTISFPAVDLPVTSPHRFRLWGLTLGMTKEILHMLQMPTLPFLLNISAPPVYSRFDIGYCIWSLTWLKSISSMGAKSPYQQQSLWDKYYFASVRKGIFLAMMVRCVVVIWLGRRWIKSRS